MRNTSHGRRKSFTVQLSSRPVKENRIIFFIKSLLPPATKLGQGYMFTGVCHSVNRGWGAWSWGVSGPGGLPGPGGGAWSQGGAWSWGGVCSQGCLLWGGLCAWWRPPPPHHPDGHCCRRYASYWNAFLFDHIFPRNS